MAMPKTLFKVLMLSLTLPDKLNKMIKKCRKKDKEEKNIKHVVGESTIVYSKLYCPNH